MRLAESMTMPEHRAVLVSMAQLAQVHEQAEQPVDGHNESLMESG
jgi:hypothetical protein